MRLWFAAFLVLAGLRHGPAWSETVQLVARDANWSVALPGEPEVRNKGRTRSWSYLDGPGNTLYMVVEAGGWPAALDEAGWRSTAGAVVGALAEGKPVEIRPEVYLGKVACRLQSQNEKGKTLQALAVQIEERRHLLLISVPLGEKEPASEGFFASLAVPGVVQGQLVNQSDWSLIFPQSPGPDLSLQCADGSRFSARELESEHPLQDFQAGVQSLGQVSGQRSYAVEGKTMQQVSIRGEGGVVRYERLVLLSERRALWLSAKGVEPAVAQAFFSSLRIWKP